MLCGLEGFVEEVGLKLRLKGEVHERGGHGGGEATCGAWGAVSLARAPQH